jgi:hypothetical protein
VRPEVARTDGGKDAWLSAPDPGTTAAYAAGNARRPKRQPGHQ